MTEIAYQSEYRIVSYDQPFAIDNRQSEACTLQQRTEFADIGKWSNMRRNSAFDLDLSGCDGFAQLRQTFSADKRRQQQAIRLQCAANLDQGSRQVVDKLQRQRRHNQIERRVGKWQRLLVRRYSQERSAVGGRVNRGRHNSPDLSTCCKDLAHHIGRSAKIDGDIELTQDSGKALTQFRCSAIEQKSLRAKLACTRLPRAEETSVKYLGTWRHCFVQ